MKSLLRHFRDYSPTEIKKIRKQWSKEQAISGIQETMLELPMETPKDKLVFLKYFEVWGRMTGVFIPESTTQTTNNILVIPQAESDELWKQRVKHQQSIAFDNASAEMATDTRTSVASG